MRGVALKLETSGQKKLVPRWCVPAVNIGQESSGFKVQHVKSQNLFSPGYEGRSNHRSPGKLAGRPTLPFPRNLLRF